MIKANPFGGYITNWIAIDPSTGSSKEILYQGSSLKRTGIPPLFPCWGDSGTALRKHGFARDVEWQVVKDTGQEILMTLDSADIKDTIKKEYPNNFQVTMSVFSEKNNLFYSMSVKNRGHKDMEISPAIHPYFNIKHHDKREIKTEGVEGFNAANFDWDNSPPDNNYPFSKSAEIFFPDWTIEVEDSSPRPVFKHMVVWSQPINSPDFNFVCFEPVTGLAGAIERKEIIIAPAGVWEMKLRFTVSFH
jgi:galactose mutarotase-like enzyme